MSRLPRRGLLTWGGRILALLGLIFVVLRLQAYWDQIDLSGFGWVEWTVIIGLSLLYGLAGVTLALAWRQLLRQFGATASRRLAVSVYGVSQISKYLPGNIFHLAARQARGMAGGLPGWPLAKAAAWELGLLAACGALFLLLALPLLVEGMAVVASAALFLSALGASAFLLSRWVGPPVGRAFAWQAAFLLTSGLLFIGVLALVGPSGPGDAGRWVPALGAYILAWLAGLITPGSPAGLGVREAVLLVLLGSHVPQAELIPAVVLARMVSVQGDAAFFLGAFALRQQSENEMHATEGS